jgi:hypothetical protein|tara:strand:+ start:432 stop:617 length:186 start_codon:yes stop_codon:yes gene_type:complete
MDTRGILDLFSDVLCSNQDGNKTRVLGVAGKNLPSSVPHIAILENGFGFIKTIPPISDVVS